MSDLSALDGLPVGTPLLGGHYKVGRAIGRGGFAITYLGSDVPMQRAVAIKEFYPFESCTRVGRSVQPSGGLGEEGYAAWRIRFVEEARTLASFDHTGIVRIHTVFEENNSAYMVMEWVPGNTLGTLLQLRGTLPVNEAIGYVKKVAGALEVVHESGLLHRDIKPDNIMVTPNGGVVLIDFGAARQFVSLRTKRMTRVLTPGYAPLEQYSLEARFGPSTDIYALSATLYHLITGSVPVPAPDRLFGAELGSPRNFVPSINPNVDAAIMKALDLSATFRHQTVSEFVAALTSVAAPAKRRPRADSGFNARTTLPDGRPSIDEVIAVFEDDLDYLRCLRDYLCEVSRDGEELVVRMFEAGVTSTPRAVLRCGIGSLPYISVNGHTLEYHRGLIRQAFLEQ